MFLACHEIEKPAGKKLAIEPGLEMLGDRIVTTGEVRFSAKSNPPKMGEPFDMFGPVVNGFKRNLKKWIILNARIKVVNDAKNILVREGDAI